MDRIVAGMEGKAMVDGKAKSLVAYHEVSSSEAAQALGRLAKQQLCGKYCRLRSSGRKDYAE